MTPVATVAQRLFWAWAVQFGVAIFAAWWMHTRGLWRALVEGDPSGISVAIACAVADRHAVVRTPRVAIAGRSGRRLRSWRDAYAQARAQAPDQAAALLSEHSHGAHETAWWFAASAIKLGLLGTVVGFIFMASRIGSMPSFDVDQIQALLTQMTAGMAIALYTTLVGLIANLWLGLQLLLLDRTADRIVADIVASARS